MKAMCPKYIRATTVFILFFCASTLAGQANETQPTPPQIESRSAAPNATVSDQNEPPSKPQWQYGGFVDLGYLLDFNHPANRIFRSRGTAWHVDRLYLN